MRTSFAVFDWDLVLFSERTKSQFRNSIHIYCAWTLPFLSISSDSLQHVASFIRKHVENSNNNEKILSVFLGLSMFSRHNTVLFNFFYRLYFPVFALIAGNSKFQYISNGKYVLSHRHKSNLYYFFISIYLQCYLQQIIFTFSCDYD